ncbi:MAG: glycosyltransferase family 1 protein [Candidatus Saccharimonadales bacterium]
MKIVIDARISGTSTGRYIDKLIEHLHTLQPKHQVIILTKAEQLEFINKIAPSFAVIETSFKEFSFDEQIGLMRQIRGLEPDLVHFGMVQQPIMYHGRVVTTMHDLTTVRFKNPSKNPVVFWIKQRVYAQVNKRAARKSAAILTGSQFVKDDIVAFAGVNPDKVTVTHESADQIPDVPEVVVGLDGTPFIMYVGRPMTHKNLPRLIKAYAELKKTRPELKLVLAGKKDVLYEQIERQAEADGVKDVVFTGFVSEGQLRWLYEHCAAYIFPSLSEGFGLPGLEAMLHGAPVVSSNATCLPEIYGDAAHYFDPLDVNDIATKIDEVLSDNSLRQDLITKGKAQAAKYSWQRMAEQTLAVYQKILGE